MPGWFWPTIGDERLADVQPVHALCCPGIDRDRAGDALAHRKVSGSTFWPAVWIGLSIAAPVGPIGLLVIQRTLRHGLTTGLVTGMGAAVADAAYGAVGAYGVSALVAWLQAARVPLVLAGGAFLLILAWRTWRAAPAAEAASGAGAAALWPAFAGTVVLTLSNPATALSFVAIFDARAQRLVGRASALMLAGFAIWQWGVLALSRGTG